MTKLPVRPIIGGRSLVPRLVNRFYATGRAWGRRRTLLDFLSATAGSAPAATADSPRIAILVCKRDLSMATAALKAYVLAAGKAIRWQIHDDGTLTRTDRERLGALFPGSRVVSRAEADARAGHVLADFPHVAAWRATYPLGLKAVDVPLFWEGTHVRYIDSDVLANGDCADFLAAVPARESRFNRDTETAYVASPTEIAEAFGIAVAPEINSGTFVVPHAAFDLALIERLLSDDRFASWMPRYPHFIEQTVIAICACAYGTTSFLPPEYDVSFERPFAASAQKHYVTLLRHGFEVEGLAYLLENGRVGERWRSLQVG